MNEATGTQEQQIGNPDSREALRRFCEAGFNGHLENAALALGRPADMLQQMLNGEAEIDEDLDMKMRGIAKERDLPID